MWHLWSYLDEGKHMSSTTQWHNNRIKTHMLGGATPLRKIKGWWEDCVVGEGTRTDLHRSTLRGVEIRYTKRKGSWKFRRKELCTFMKLTKQRITCHTSQCIMTLHLHLITQIFSSHSVNTKKNIFENTRITFHKQVQHVVLSYIHTIFTKFNPLLILTC